MRQFKADKEDEVVSNALLECADAEEKADVADIEEFKDHAMDESSMHERMAMCYVAVWVLLSTALLITGTYLLLFSDGGQPKSVIRAEVYTASVDSFGQESQSMDTAVSPIAMVSDAMEADQSFDIGLQIICRDFFMFDAIETCLSTTHMNRPVNTLVPLPTEIGLLSQLTFLEFNDVFFSTSRSRSAIPSEIGKLTKLNYLSFIDNDMKGTIPTEVGELKELGVLIICDSYMLTGTIPSEIGSLNRLSHLDLIDNSDLTGTVPSEIAVMTQLSYLALGGNSLKGSIPTEIGRLTNLTTLYLECNSWTGTMPSEIGLLTNLTSFKLDSDYMTGTVPGEIEDLTNLRNNFDLYSMGLTGSIPAVLCDNLVRHVKIEIYCDGQIEKCECCHCRSSWY